MSASTASAIATAATSAPPAPPPQRSGPATAAPPPRVASTARRIAVCLGVLAALACAPAEPDGPWAEIGDQRVALEITRTPEEMALGLGRRDSLPRHHGMLFEYPQATFPSFWMKDMRFDIDIVWIRAGRIVDIHHNVPHDVEPPLPNYRPRELADTVLEVPAGYARLSGWRVGDRVAIHRDADGGS